MSDEIEEMHLFLFRAAEQQRSGSLTVIARTFENALRLIDAETIEEMFEDEDYEDVARDSKEHHNATHFTFLTAGPCSIRCVSSYLVRSLTEHIVDTSIHSVR